MNRVDEFPVAQAPPIPFFDTKSWIMLLLLILLSVSLLGISLGEKLDMLWRFVAGILSDFGFYSGTLLNRSADVVSDTAIGGVEIAEGAVKNIGNILIGPVPSPEPDSTSNPIQNPITATKTSWCLVGEYQNQRGCVPVSESDICLSGQVFPTQ